MNGYDSDSLLALVKLGAVYGFTGLTAGSGGWTVFSPIPMTTLLLRVSGEAAEKDT